MKTRSRDNLYNYITNPSIGVIRYAVTESTNLSALEYARLNNPKTPVVFIADEQTAGRGRLGRSFSSQRGGIYMSILTPIDKTMTPTDLTAYAAVIASRALSALYSVDPGIKWVNDIYLGGKKLAGILVQGVVSPEGELTHAVMGIGVNVRTKRLPEEIREIATSLKIEGIEADIDMLAGEIVSRYIEGLTDLASPEIIEEYRARSFIIGSQVNVITPLGEYPATVKGISDRCELIIETEDGETRLLSSGDVSIRKK